MEELMEFTNEGRKLHDHASENHFGKPAYHV